MQIKLCVLNGKTLFLIILALQTVRGKAACLFNVNISELISCISGSGIGCTCGGKLINILAYADDLVLLAPSWAGLQSLLHILESFSTKLDMIVNCKKTVCMIYKPTCSSKALSCDFPKFCLRNGEIAYVETFRYLGHLISNDAVITVTLNEKFATFLFVLTF